MGAQRGSWPRLRRCPLWGQKRTSRRFRTMSAENPQRCRAVTVVVAYGIAVRTSLLSCRKSGKREYSCQFLSHLENPGGYRLVQPHIVPADFGKPEYEKTIPVSGHGYAGLVDASASISPGISEQADPVDPALCSGRRGRALCTNHYCKGHRIHRPAIRDRKPARRRRQYCRELCREGCARRLHNPAEPEWASDQSGDLSQSAV